MSFILTQWLKSPDIALLAPHENINLEQEFASGFQFGRLLDTLGLQDDFDQKFVKGSTVDALIKNYTSLEETLRSKLHLKLPS
ncbi:hypothetical protein HDU91_004609, partial [Kappamyces sp. JEL0680]